MYMDFSMLIGLEIWIDEGRLMDMCSICSMEINWMIKKQEVINFSKIEVEYMLANHARKESIWMHKICSWIRFEKKAMEINCNIQSAIFLANNPTYHSKENHIDTKYHFFSVKF